MTDAQVQPFQRVTIVGAGAIGGWLGVHLAKAGCSVGAPGRGETLAALREHGLRLHLGGELRQVPVSAAGSAAELGAQDLVVIAVKAPSLASVAATIGPLIGPDTVVLTAMNGVP